MISFRNSYWIQISRNHICTVIAQLSIRFVIPKRLGHQKWCYGRRGFSRDLSLRWFYGNIPSQQFMGFRFHIGYHLSRIWIIPILRLNGLFSILKIRRCNNRLIFIIGTSISENVIFILRQDPVWMCRVWPEISDVQYYRARDEGGIITTASRTN